MFLSYIYNIYIYILFYCIKKKEKEKEININSYIYYYYLYFVKQNHEYKNENKMVKNTKGGNKSKNLARKHLSTGHEKRVLRTSTCDLEQYGVVTQMNGHGMFYVQVEDGKRLLGRIRSKFSGKSMRQNMIRKGSIVLMGLREWEAPHFKEADLLEIYDAEEIKQLRKIPTINVLELERQSERLTGAATTSAAALGTEDPSSSSTTKKSTTTTTTDYADDILFVEDGEEEEEEEEDNDEVEVDDEKHNEAVNKTTTNNQTSINDQTTTTSGAYSYVTNVKSSNKSKKDEIEIAFDEI